MPDRKEHFEELLLFIKEKRSNEIYFEQLEEKLTQECKLSETEIIDSKYLNEIEEVKRKYAEEYKNSKEKTGNAWPEFENFVSAFERAVASSLNKL